MAVSVTLQHDKLTLTDTFAAVSRVTTASPVGYYPLFVLSENVAVGPTSERFERVATLNDLATLSENRLQRLLAGTAGEFTGLGIVAGDILTIDSAPDYWIDSVLTQAKFEVSAATADYVDIVTTADFPTALANVSWTIRNSADVALRGTGTNGSCVRLDTGTTTFLRRRVTRVFDEVTAATNHVSSVSSYVEALIEDANSDADQFSGVVTETYPT